MCFSQGARTPLDDESLLWWLGQIAVAPDVIEELQLHNDFEIRTDSENSPGVVIPATEDSKLPCTAAKRCM